MKKSYDIDEICTSLLKSGYNMPCVDGYEKKDRRVSSGSDNRFSETYPESAGKEKAFVVGCSANNSDPSARTLNGNNALGNGNDNYCGAFAVTSGENGKYLTACPARANSLENRAVTDGYGQCDYGSLKPEK